MKVSWLRTLVLVSIALCLSGRDANGQKPADRANKITVAAVQSKDVTITQRYVCKIQSRRYIDVRTPTKGQIAASHVKEGQAVKQGDLLFQVAPPKAKLKPDAETQDKVVSIKAPFDGLAGRLLRQQGSVVLDDEKLTTLFDNSVMWVYFNMPERRYLESMAEPGKKEWSPDVELFLADGSKFPRTGKIGAIDAGFNKDTATIAFRADFPNPDGLLRHGQTGTVVIGRVLKNAVVVPQQATFEKRDKRYVYIVDKDHVAHQRPIVVQHETDDLFVVKEGVKVGDKIVVEGVRQVRDGSKLEQL